MIEDAPDEGPHKRPIEMHRSSTTRQQSSIRQCYERKKHSTITKEYKKGDTVGIKIADIDRTNTAARILPCKVKEVKK